MADPSKRASPVRSLLAAWGARFRDAGGVEVAEAFSDVAAEHAALRGACGLIDRFDLATFRVTGDDRTTFLQGMLTNDVARLAPGQGCRAAFLTVQGRVVADPCVFVCEGEILLQCLPEAAPGLLDGLRRHLVADDVEIDDVTGDVATLSIQGPQAAGVVATILRTPITLAEEFDHQQMRLGEQRVRLLRVGEFGGPGFQLQCPTDRAAEAWRIVMDRGQPCGLVPVGAAAAEIRRVEVGIPRYGVDMDASRLVLEVGLRDAISATKGCYLGQEVVERGTARGHVNRKLTGLRLLADVVPPRGAAVLVDGVEVGTVTSAVDSPAAGCPVALAYVRREHLAPGGSICVRTPAGMVAAEIEPPPFERR